MDAAGGRLKVLDGLRAVAVLIVMVSHANLENVVPGGLGVTIFFVLSGYLISTLLLIEHGRDGRINFQAFYLRRSVRIIPPMLICYAVAVALVALGFIDRPMNYAGVIWDLMFLTNYTPPLQPNSMIPIPLWSLDIEEHFYIIFPVAFIAILQCNGRVRIGLVVMLIIAALVGRIGTHLYGDADRIYYWTHTRFDAILFGVLLTLIQIEDIRWGRSWAGLLLGLAMIFSSLVFRDELFRETIRYSVQGIALLLIFKFLLESGNNFAARMLALPQCKFIADKSYVLYLIHLPLLMAAEHTLTGLTMPLRFVVGFAASIAFASAMQRYVETPLLNWRKRIEGGVQPKGPLKPTGVE